MNDAIRRRAPPERRLSRAEIERLGKTLREAAQDGEHPTGLGAIRFLLLTGFRRMEGLGVERTWLDEEEGAIRFPDTKLGAETRVVGQAAIDLLIHQPKTKSSFFFPADWGDEHFIGVIRVLDPSASAPSSQMSHSHTLRHTFASLAGDLGFSGLTIVALLGHALRGVTQRYVHIDEALRMAADRVADEMADILDGKAAMTRPRRRTGGQSPEVSEATDRRPQANGSISLTLRPSKS